MGVGYGLIYLQNSSTGGADFVVMSLKVLRPHLSLGKIIFLTDFVIVMVGGILFGDVDGIIYGLIINFIFSVVIDKVMYGANAGKLTLPDPPWDIAFTIDRNTWRGRTSLAMSIQDIRPAQC